MLARLDSIHKDYGGQPVLRDVSLTIDAGEIVSLVGRSGSGKSTLLHILGGLDRRFRGRAEVLGHDLAQMDDRALAEMRNREIGFVFQSFNLLEHLTVAQNVALPSHFGVRLDEAEMRRRVERALDRVGIVEKIDGRPGELSGGQKQRVAIARALFSQPKLLLADEPTGNLDSETGDHIIELFQTLNRDGLTILVVTHEERVSKAASRAIRLEDGRVASALGASA